MKRKASLNVEEEPPSKIIKLNSDDDTSIESIDSLLDKAHKARIIKNYEFAHQLLQQASTVDILDPRIYFSKALLAWDTENSFAVHRACNEGLSVLKLSNIPDRQLDNSYWACIFKGLIAEEQNDNDKALEIYKEARKVKDYDFRNDDGFTAEFNFGFVLMMQHAYWNAIQYFDKAKSKKIPKYMEALCLNNIGFAYGRIGLDNKGIEYFTAALDVYPEFPLLLQNRMDSYVDMRQYEKAIADGKQLLSLVGSHASKRDLARFYCSLTYIYLVMSDDVPDTTTSAQYRSLALDYATKTFNTDKFCTDVHGALIQLHEGDAEEKIVLVDRLLDTYKNYDAINISSFYCDLLKFKRSVLSILGRTEEAKIVETKRLICKQAFRVS
jgi:tetratricopeptide (TPR) repeat protein